MVVVVFWLPDVPVTVIVDCPGEADCEGIIVRTSEYGVGPDAQL